MVIKIQGAGVVAGNDSVKAGFTADIVAAGGLNGIAAAGLLNDKFVSICIGSGNGVIGNGNIIYFEKY